MLWFVAGVVVAVIVVAAGLIWLAAAGLAMWED